MSLNRRDFFKLTATGALGATVADQAFARENRALSENALGILYDSTLCIGCKSCEVACKRLNDLPKEHDTNLEKQYQVNGVWDSGSDLSTSCFTKIKVFKDGTGKKKDSETNGYAFIKAACRHCVDPGCSSACPTSALVKNPTNGIVSWDPDACCGCRYCEVACPFTVPRFEYDRPVPRIRKCSMCKHVLAKGGEPGCTDFCPTGASVFGKTKDLLQEANRRLAFKEGAQESYPVRSLTSGETQIHTVAKYIPDVYGDTEGGGTQVLTLSGVAFEKLGLPKLPEYSAAQRSETLQHTLYKGLVAPLVLLGGLVTAAYKNTGTTTHEEGGEHE